MMVRRTRVRDYQKRDGTEVREHERSLNERDRRDRFVDRIRIENSKRRREEDTIVDEAMGEYLDQVENGASHTEAMAACIEVLDQEMDGSEYSFSEEDRQRLRGEVTAEIADARKRGYQEADSPATAQAAALANKAASREDDQEERLMSIHDAISDDDQMFSMAELADDPAVELDRTAGGQPEEDESLLGYASTGFNGLASAAERRREAKVAEQKAQKKASAFARQAAQERMTDTDTEAGGPRSSSGGDKPRTPGFEPSMSITTVPNRRIVKIDQPTTAPADEDDF